METSSIYIYLLSDPDSFLIMFVSQSIIQMESSTLQTLNQLNLLNMTSIFQSDEFINLGSHHREVRESDDAMRASFLL